MAQIPVINISPSNPAAASQLLSSATTHGFVYIENNDAGIPPGDIDHMFELSKQFFAAPVAVKQKVAISSNKAGKNHGWLSRGVEKLDPGGQSRADVKEAFNMGVPLADDQPLPAPLAPHKQTLTTFQHSCHDLCTRLLRLFALALDLPDQDWFSSRHDPAKGPTGTVFRLLYYPRVDDWVEGSDVRAGAHSDYGSLTLLFQRRGQPGLEIRDGEGGGWTGVPVDPASGATDRPLPILVNIGDLLEDWTGGLLKSTVHRVVSPPTHAGGEVEDRYSMAYFCHPLDEARLEAVPSGRVRAFAEKTGKGTGRRRGGGDGEGEVLTAGEHLMERLGRSYSVK